MPLDQFVADPKVTKIAKIMKLIIPDSASKPVELADDAKFVICEGGGASCLHYAVLGNKCKLSMCQDCKLKRGNELKRAKRHKTTLASPESDKKTKASSRCNFRYLSEEDGAERINNLNVERKKISATVRRLAEVLADTNESFNKDDNPELLNCIKSALAEVDGKAEEFKRSLLGAIMENEVSKSVKNGSEEELSTNDYQGFVDQVMAEMKNFALQVNDKVCKR